MDSNFWHDRWARGEIGFHEAQVNPDLLNHLDSLNIVKGGRIFVPLCGKTNDIGWFLAQGYGVAGVELSSIAVNELFQSLAIAPQISEFGTLMHYSAENIDIWVGDIFDLTQSELGEVDAVYDRAAIVALPPDMRARYAAHLAVLTRSARQLVITFEYDQSLQAGPPFSVDEEELSRHYGDIYQLNRLTSYEISGGLKGQLVAAVSVWHLRA